MCSLSTTWGVCGSVLMSYSNFNKKRTSLNHELNCSQQMICLCQIVFFRGSWISILGVFQSSTPPHPHPPRRPRRTKAGILQYKSRYWITRSRVLQYILQITLLDYKGFTALASPVWTTKWRLLQYPQWLWIVTLWTRIIKF